jgi:hypothetical protein
MQYQSLLIDLQFDDNFFAGRIVYSLNIVQGYNY